MISQRTDGRADPRSGGHTYPRPDRQAGPAYLSGTALKIIGIVTMLIDHIGAVLLETGVLRYQDPVYNRMILGTTEGMRCLDVDMLLRSVGRASFPIFCFLLVEGYVHTGNYRRYLKRMLVFALVSEIPFDLAVWNTPFYMYSQNIYFTLSIGLLALYYLDRIRIVDIVLRKTVSGSILAGACLAAHFLRVDYGGYGLLLILLFYYLRGKRLLLFAAGSAMLVLTEGSGYGLYFILSMACISLYNGKRGRLRHKYLFYWFYPAHLLALFGIRYLVMGVPLG